MVICIVFVGRLWFMALPPVLWRKNKKLRCGRSSDTALWFALWGMDLLVEIPLVLAEARARYIVHHGRVEVADLVACAGGSQYPLRLRHVGV